MRTIPAVLTAALATGAVALLAGCSSGGSTSTTSSLPTGFTQTQQQHVETLLHPERTGIAPQVWRSPFPPTSAHRVGPNVKPDDLFVTDAGNLDVEIIENKTWTDDGSITSGINGGDGDWLDKKGNLYVANYNGVNVTEYAPGATTPTFTYSAGLGDPIIVTTDLHGNVFVGDYARGGAGFINEYKQGSNTVSATCSPGGGVEGVAVDAAGDVFADYVAGGSGHIVEYKKGLKGCKATALGATLTFPGGMVIDDESNLIACDQTGAKVDVIAPPYSSVTSSYSGFTTPFHVALSKHDNELFVADDNAPAVDVLKYPSGTVLKVLGSANGISTPYGVTDSPNAVF